MGYLIGREEAIVKVIKQGKECGIDFGFEVINNPLSIRFWLLEETVQIASFTLIEQKNCCGILVSTNTWVKGSHKERGIAQELMPLKEAIAKEFGYSLLLATVNITGNPAEVHILEKFGWKLGKSFVNKRTKNTVGIYTKEIE